MWDGTFPAVAAACLLTGLRGPVWAWNLVPKGCHMKQNASGNSQVAQEV